MEQKNITKPMVNFIILMCDDVRLLLCELFVLISEIIGFPHL